MSEIPMYDRDHWTARQHVRKLEHERDQAIRLAMRYGSIDGSHHKSWVIDQMVRILAGDRYAQIVKDACAGEDGPDTYNWDCGVPP